ncbi:hypothetical protein GCM10028811_27990 [Uliginosibacterium sediminicola]
MDHALHSPQLRQDSRRLRLLAGFVLCVVIATLVSALNERDPDPANIPATPKPEGTAPATLAVQLGDRNIARLQRREGKESLATDTQLSDTALALDIPPTHHTPSGVRPRREH